MKARSSGPFSLVTPVTAPVPSLAALFATIVASDTV